MRYFFIGYRNTAPPTPPPPPLFQKKGKKEKENFAINVYLQNKFTFNAFINLQS